MPLASDRNSKQMHNQRHLTKSVDHCSYQTHNLNIKLLNLARLICTTLYHQIIWHCVSVYRRSQIDINSSYGNRNLASMSHECILIARSSIRVMQVQFIIRQYRSTKQTTKNQRRPKESTSQTCMLSVLICDHRPWIDQYHIWTIITAHIRSSPNLASMRACVTRVFTKGLIYTLDERNTLYQTMLSNRQ